MRRWALFGLIGLAALICALLAVGAGAQSSPLTLEERTASSLSVAWNWDKRPVVAFEVAWRPRGEAAAASWLSVRKGPSERRHTISELDAGTHYIVRVRALDAAGLPLSDLRGVFATAESAPLTLELHSSRDLCTAGTLTEISWTISGGVAPYRLSIEGAAVDVSADNIRVNCGALTEAEAGDAEAALAAKQITATITDSRGVHRQAAIEVARARALPALPPAAEHGDSVWAHRGELGFKWLAPATPYSCRKPSCFAIRWRAVGDVDAATWTHAPLTLNLSERNLAVGIVRGLADGVAYEAAAAAMRDPIELETPEALRWTAPLSGTTLTNPTGLTATATYDTVTVRWDRQPTARFWSVQLRGPDGALGRNVQSWDAASWGDPASSVHEVVFRDVPSSTDYEVGVDWNVMEGYEETSAETSVRTLPLPAGREPLPRGPQNLRATSTHSSISVTWDRPFSGDSSDYVVYLFETDYSLLRRLEFVYPPASQITLSDLESETEYRVVVMHNSIVRAEDEVGVTTSAPSERGADESDGEGAAGRGGSPKRSAGQPLFEWWVDGRPTSPPLDLKLRSSRDLCTAGTLTEISWQVSGGVAPYQLSIEGVAVDLDADNIRINCGALTEAEAGDAEAALAAKTVSAVVIDSRGVQRQAALEVARARALPAPSYVNTNVQQTLIALYWSVDDGVRGTDGTARYLVRSRPTGQSVWNYIHEERSDSRKSTAAGIRGLSEGAAYEAQVAAMRDPLEGLTPAVLTWSATETATTAKAPTGVRATATHDTVTVVWDAQPSVDYYYIRLVERGSQEPGRYESIDASPTAIREVTFRGLDAATSYTVTVSVDGDVWSRLETDVDIATAQAPANWTPSERPPVIIRTHATHDTIEVSWAAPPAGARLFYLVSVEHPASPYVHAEWVDGGTAFSLDRLAPETTYTVHVHHHDLHGGTATVEITTLPSPPVREANEATRAADRGGSLAPSAKPKPLFEWWADGRPTSPPLHLELRSSRELCTAGTLTEVSWQISGGVAPYTLSIEGAAVDVDTDNVRVNCGALTEAEAGDAEAALAAKTVSAVVTDSRGVQRQAALDVARARALPAPTPRAPTTVRPTSLHTDWVTIGGAHHDAPIGWWLIRWRPADADSGWNYNKIEQTRPGDVVFGRFGGLSEGSSYTFAVAALRDPIEQLTPNALTWSSELEARTTTTPTGVGATATHDTVTVTWDDQPEANVYVKIIRADGAGREEWIHVRPAADPSDEATFINLEPEAEYDITVAVDDAREGRLSTAAKVTTAAAPTGWQAPPRGAQNLSVTATHDTITVTWDAPVPNTRDRWIVYVGHPSWPRPYSHWVSAPLTFTLEGLSPATTYTVSVVHLDLYGVEVSTTVTTADAPRHGHYDQPPLIEWWADGRPASPPLDLKLKSSRELCTAGTLTEVSWEISGGVAPYELSIEGEAVDVDADNVRVNCGALTEAEVGDAEAALAAKRITATVTDSRGVQRQAALDVDRARVLPAPTNVRRFSQVGEVIVSWDEVDGAGSQSPTIVHSGRSVTGLVRTRANHDGAPWRYHTATRLYADEWVLGPTSGVQVLSVAAVRHPLEVETPDALSWSDDLVYASTTVAQNVTLAATHDTVTVSWDRQPHVGYQQVWVWLSRADNEGGRRWKTLHEELGVAGRHTVIFNGLPADTQLEVVIEMHYAGAAERPDLPSNVTQHTVRTLLAPPGWTPAPVGPQSLRYMQTSGVTTVLWDEPYPDAEPSWFLTIENLATGAIWGTWVSGTAWSCQLTWSSCLTRCIWSLWSTPISSPVQPRFRSERLPRRPPVKLNHLRPPLGRCRSSSGGRTAGRHRHRSI